MNSIRAALLVLFGLGFAILSTVAPALAAEECHLNTCVTADVIPTSDGWSVHLLMRRGSDSGYDFYNMLMPGHEQMELQGTEQDLRVSAPAGWDGAFGVQACRNHVLGGTGCDTWSTFRVELPIASDDRNFCVRYAGNATAEGISGQQQSCGFEITSGRWSTDNSFHLKWCLGQFRAAGGVASKLSDARNLANSEDAIRVDGLKTCQANAADKQAYADQVADEMRVTGKSPEQCQASNNSCEGRMKAQGPINSLGAIASECAPRFQMCMGNALADQKAAVDNRNFETQVTGKTVAECQISNQACEGRIRSSRDAISAPAFIATECAPYLQICMANATAALAAASTDDTAAPSPDDTADTGDDAADRRTATVRENGVEVFDAAGGNGNKTGELSQDDTVEVAGACPQDNWCNVLGPSVPNGNGWVYQGPDYKSLNPSGGGGATSGGFKLEIPLPGKNKKVVITTPDIDLGKVLKSTKSKAAPAPEQFAAVSPVASFAGVWDSKTDKNWTYVITLNQVGKQVTGGYFAQDGSTGTFKGTVAANGKTFNYKWTADGGYVGTGFFTMISEGVMDGKYDTTAPADMNPAYKTGTWHAERR